MPSKIVVRFRDGRILKGTVEDFYTNKETFHLNEYKTGKGHVAKIDELKAVFFVKSFEGQKDHKNKQGFYNVSDFGIRTVVKFQDGEVMYGYSQDYNPYTKGFFLFPDDKNSNNTKIFIPNASIFDIKFGEDIHKSEYGKISPKFIKKIVSKVINVTIQISVGKFPLEGAKIKVLETNEIKETKRGGKDISLALKPGKYNLEITYDKYTVKKVIEVDKEHSSFKIDFQKETS